MSTLFLSDIDGTLVDGHLLHPSVKEAVSAYTQDGNYFSLATGRNAFAIRWLIEQLSVNAPCILLSGAATYDAQRDVLCNMIALPGQARSALQTLLSEYPGVGIQAFTPSGLCNLRLNPFLAAHGIPEEIAIPVCDISALDGETILKIGLCCEDTNVLRAAAERLFSDEKRFRWHFSHAIGIEVLSFRASKGLALNELMRFLPERPDCIAVAGDSPNDLSLFEFADICFAPESAFPEVKAAADHIIPPPEQGGVAYAMDIIRETCT